MQKGRVEMVAFKKGTLCSWCDKPVRFGFVYKTENVCERCFKAKRKELGMDWVNSKDYDDWKTTPPEDIRQPEILECECGAILKEGETFYEFGDGRIYCDSCLEDYLSDFRCRVGRK